MAVSTHPQPAAVLASFSVGALLDRRLVVGAARGNPTAGAVLGGGTRAHGLADEAVGAVVGRVFLDSVDLPGLVPGPVDPDLVLAGIAAGGVVLDLGEQAELVEAGWWRR